MIYARYGKLITVLFFAAMFLILSFLVMSVTSCDELDQSVQTVSPDGTLFHPYPVDPAPDATPVDTWTVLTVRGQQKWVLNWLYDIHGRSDYALHAGDYILYRSYEYRIAAIDRKALTMTAHIIGK